MINFKLFVTRVLVGLSLPDNHQGTKVKCKQSLAKLWITECTKTLNDNIEIKSMWVKEQKQIIQKQCKQM